MTNNKIQLKDIDYLLKRDIKVLACDYTSNWKKFEDVTNKLWNFENINDYMKYVVTKIDSSMKNEYIQEFKEVRVSSYVVIKLVQSMDVIKELVDAFLSNIESLDESIKVSDKLYNVLQTYRSIEDFDCESLLEFYKKFVVGK